MDNILFPMVMRVYAKTIAYELVPVKPIDGLSDREREIKKRNKKIQKILDRIKKGE